MEDNVKRIKVGVLFLGYGNPEAEQVAREQNITALTEALAREGKVLAEGDVDHVCTRVPPTLTLRSEGSLDGRMTSTWSAR